jgi:hypothetical protein
MKKGKKKDVNIGARVDSRHLATLVDFFDSEDIYIKSISDLIAVSIRYLCRLITDKELAIGDGKTKLYIDREDAIEHLKSKRLLTKLNAERIINEIQSTKFRERFLKNEDVNVTENQFVQIVNKFKEKTRGLTEHEN